MIRNCNIAERQLMVRAIRGATTVQFNDAEEIVSGTSELLQRIVEQNTVSIEDIISIFFTATNDLNAAFPALAARRLGWTGTALMCMNEIDVPGSLKKCIRILMHVNTEKSKDEIRCVYINGADVLRPDLS